MSSAPMLNYFRMFTKCAEEPTNWVHFSWSDRPNPLGGPFEPGVLPGTCSGATGLLIRQGAVSCSVPRISTTASFALLSNSTACSLETVGKPLRKLSTLSPAARCSISIRIGTLVP